MVATILALPILIVSIILQSAIVSETPLLQGSADLIMLILIAWTLQERVQQIWQWTIIGCIFLGFISASSWMIMAVSYLGVTAIVLITRKRLWNTPFLSMWLMTIVGTFVIHGVMLAGRWLEGVDISILTAFNFIILPSLLLNLLLAAPMFAIVRDLANWLYPREVEV